MSLRKQILIILAVCGLNFFINNCFLFPDIMEARNLITAREMVQKGNWLAPTMNDEPRLAKPPLPTWFNAVTGHWAGMDSLALHRIPGALMGLLLILFLFQLTRTLFSDPLIPLVAACVGATSFYIVFMARQATWDIYCHAFMLGAIAQLVVVWKARSGSFRRYALAGVLMGLSFMSKGPVSFFALLLPFLLSWLLFMDRSVFRRDWRGFLVCGAIGLFVALLWPGYTLLTQTDALLQTLDAEVGAWSNRHVRPFYQYWSFPLQTGIWSIVTVATLAYPYARRRLTDRRYLLFLGWTLIAVALLSIPAEKKERYLLPVLIPMAGLIAQYLVYLYRAQRSGTLTYADRLIVRGNALLFLLITAVAPVGLYVAGLRGSLLLATLVVFGGVALLWVQALRRFNLAMMFWATLLLMSSVSLVVLPALPQVFYTNERYTSLGRLQQAAYYPQKFYGYGIKPMEIWALGKPVGSLPRTQDTLRLPPDERWVVLSETRLSATSFVPTPGSLLLQDSVWYHPRRVDKVLYVYTVRHDKQTPNAGINPTR